MPHGSPKMAENERLHPGIHDRLYEYLMAKYPGPGDEADAFFGFRRIGRSIHQRATSGTVRKFVNVSDENSSPSRLGSMIVGYGLQQGRFG